MKKIITREEYRKLRRVLPHPGAGHINEVISHLGHIWGGYNQSCYQTKGIKDVHCAIAYLQKFPPQVDEAEAIIKRLQTNLKQCVNLDRSFDMILLRLDGYRLQNDLFEVVDDETCPGR